MPHHPPHIYIDDTWYIATASTNQRRPFLRSDENKELVIQLITSIAMNFEFSLFAWVILDNHYHILFRTSDGKSISPFFARLHGRVAHDLNQQDRCPGRQLWHNYWDTCIRSERDFWTRFNYIHHNPVKHGYVSRIEEWHFSSYPYYRDHEGDEWLADIFRRYPIIDFTDQQDSF